MTVSVTITGLDQLNAKLNSLADTTKVREAVKESAMLVESDAKVSIQHGVGGGRVYRHGSITHVASAPGNPPSTDTGILVNSITTTMSEDGLTAEVGSSLDYAFYLEYGTKKMGARPFLEPALDKNRDEIVQTIASAIGSST